MAQQTRTGTRERILDAAEGLITDSGYAATSIDRIIAAVGITKGAFFYHFDSKLAMARALVERNARLDIARMDEYAARARRLHDDPLQSLLVFLGLYIELVEGIDGPVPGCTFVSFSAEAGQFDVEIMQILDEVVIAWRERVAAWLDEAAAAHPPVHAFDTDSLADMLNVVFEGSFIVARMSQDTRVFQQQLRHYRRYVELLFTGR